MNITIDNFFLSDTDKNNIIEWIKSFSNNNIKKPLCISGNIGTGKTTLVNIILKDYTIINIDNHVNNISSYIESVLLRKDISMMFSKEKEYKAILFDNIINNNAIIKELIYIIKDLKKYKNTPIVFTTNNITLRKISKIINKCIHIRIKYSDKQFATIIKKKDIKPINKIFNYNLHSIDYINLTDNIKGSNIYDTECDINNIINKLDVISITKIFIKCSCIYNVLSLNILDHIYRDIDIINLINIYRSMTQYDIYESFKTSNNMYEYIDNSILLSIIIPLYYIKISFIKIKNIKYNSYISKSIIYTNINNLISNDYEYYNILVILLLNSTPINNTLINYKKCIIKVLNYYIRLSNIIYNKQISISTIKDFTALLNK